MKLLLLAELNSTHTIKWVSSLSKMSINICVFGLAEPKTDIYTKLNNVEIVCLNHNIKRNDKLASKLIYMKALYTIKSIIRRYKPDIMHAHYATSYGMLGALQGFHPLVISVWGSDVFLFPKKSFIHKAILSFNLKKADKVLSTSIVMAKEANLYTNKKIEVTPFGIDLNVFQSMEVSSLFAKDDFVVGTVKTLEEVYGIKYLIKAFKIICDRYQDNNFKLLIVGDGSLKKSLIQLTKDLKIYDKTIFTGAIPFCDVPKYHNMLSVFVAASLSESFGVAAIEASACSKPVIVTDIGGLPEVIKKDVTGLVVNDRNPKEIADAIELLLMDKDLRNKLGSAGRNRVKKLYNWDDNVKQMYDIYRGLTDVK